MTRFFLFSNGDKNIILLIDIPAVFPRLFRLYAQTNKQTNNAKSSFIGIIKVILTYLNCTSGSSIKSRLFSTTAVVVVVVFVVFVVLNNEFPS